MIWMLPDVPDRIRSTACIVQSDCADSKLRVVVVSLVIFAMVMIFKRGEDWWILHDDYDHGGGYFDFDFDDADEDEDVKI